MSVRTPIISQRPIEAIGASKLIYEKFIQEHVIRFKIIHRKYILDLTCFLVCLFILCKPPFLSKNTDFVDKYSKDQLTGHRSDQCLHVWTNIKIVTSCQLSGKNLAICLFKYDYFLRQIKFRYPMWFATPNCLIFPPETISVSRRFEMLEQQAEVW